MYRVCRPRVVIYLRSAHARPFAKPKTIPTNKEIGRRFAKGTDATTTLRRGFCVAARLSVVVVAIYIKIGGCTSTPN